MSGLCPNCDAVAGTCACVYKICTLHGWEFEPCIGCLEAMRKELKQYELTFWQRVKQLLSL